MSPVRTTTDEGGRYGSVQFLDLADKLAAVPDDVRRRLTPKLRRIGQRTVEEARSRAAWSSRIPSAIRLRVSFAGKNPGLILSVDRHQAPHGRPYEGILTGTFRHPVFGNTDVWVAQEARPYLWPAAVATQQDAAQAAEEAIDDALAAAGFR